MCHAQEGDYRRRNHHERYHPLGRCQSTIELNTRHASVFCRLFQKSPRRIERSRTRRRVRRMTLFAHAPTMPSRIPMPRRKDAMSRKFRGYRRRECVCRECPEFAYIRGAVNQLVLLAPRTAWSRRPSFLARCVVVGHAVPGGNILGFAHPSLSTTVRGITSTGKDAPEPKNTPIETAYGSCEE